MVCHEVWEYEDHRHTATLTDFALACRDCNFVLHPGAALEVGFRQEATGKGSIAQRGNHAIEHLSTVNSITVDEAHSILGQALKLHKERSRHKEWQIVIPDHMIEKYPSLNTAHYTQLTPTLKAKPLLIMPCGLPDPNHVETFVDLLSERWSAFESKPHLRTSAETFRNFKFSTFRDDAKKSGSLPRHQVWILQYRQNPHLRSLSKTELFEYGLMSSSDMEDMFCTESKEKLTPELMDAVGQKFMHFIEEMNFRGIDMREFESFQVNVSGQNHLS